MAKRLAEAYVSIEADSRLFRAEALAGLKKALAGVEAKIPLTADTKSAITQIEILKKRMEALGKQLAEVKIGADGKPLEATVRRLQLKLLEVAKTVASVTIGGDTTKIDAAIARSEAKLVGLYRQASALKLDADEKALAAKIAKAEAELAGLEAQASGLQLDADDKALQAKLFKEYAQLETLNRKMSNLQLDADDKALLSKIATMKAQIVHLENAMGKMKIPMDIVAAKRKVDSLKADIAVLKDEASRIELSAHYEELLAAIDASEARIAVLKSDAADIELIAKAVALDAAVDASRAKLKVLKEDGRVELVARAVELNKTIAVEEDLLRGLKREAADIRIAGPDTGELAGAELSMLRLEKEFGDLRGSAGALNVALVTGGRNFGRFGLGVLTARVALFGGLSAVSGWHLALDGVVETLAVVVPALVTAAAGLAAFGIAGADAARAVYQRLQNIHTVADATNKTIAPMTGNLEALHAQVRPQVWQLYGDAIAIAGTKTGLFNQLAVSTGGVIDRFAAKITVLATTSGTGLSNFLKVGQRDLAEFGRIAASLGSAFGKLIQVTQQTHIAEYLLNIVGAAAKAFDIFTRLPLPLLATVVAIHGIYLWSGLAASGIIGLLRPLERMTAAAAGAKLAGTAVKDLADAGNASKFRTLGATLSDLGTNLKALPGRVVTLGKAFLGLFANGWTWAVVGVVLLAGLAIALSRTKSATDRFIDSLNTMVSRASVFTVINTLGAGLIQTNTRLAAANSAVAAGLKAMQDRMHSASSEAVQYGSNQNQLVNDTRALAAEHDKLAGQLTLVTGRLTYLTQAFGTQGLTGAMALAHLAGVNLNQLLSTDNKVWAAAVQQIAGVVQGYANMGQGATQLANDINVLTVVQSDQLKNVQTLNSAFDEFTKIVSGPVTGFLTLANTLKRFGSDASVAGAQMSGLGTGMTGVSKKVTDASLQLQTDFQDTFSAATQMADAMRLTGTASAQQVSAIRNVVQVMIPMAGSNKAAAAEVSALAQEAGGPATTNLKELAKWAGHTKDPLSAAQKAAQDAAISFYNMSLDAQKLGTTLSQDLTKDMAAAVENAVGLQGAMNKFALDLKNAGTSIVTTNSDRKALIADLALVGIKGKQADAIVNAISGTLKSSKGPVSDAAVAFENFAIHGLGLSQAKADALWKTLAASDLPALAAKADTTRAKFDDLAVKGLNLTQNQADALWKHLRMQYLDQIATKTDTSKTKFEQLAKDGLDLTKGAADALWTKLRQQYLDTLANKSDMTKAKFEQLASQMGITRGEADKLWASLRRVASGSPYVAKTIVEASGSGQITIQGSGWATGSGNVRFHAARGAYINAGSGPTADDVPAMLSKGELVVPTHMVKAGAVDHLRGKLPGFASGGLVGLADQAPGLPPQATRIAGNLATKAVSTFIAKTMAAIKAEVNSNDALAGSGPAVVSYARSFLGKIPYVFGGNSLSSGIDCSGFTQAVYGHFGIHAPRTSESQFAWATKSAPTPGGLAFYVSPAGGPPPGHVAIVQDAKSVISQGGGMGPQIESLRFLPLMGTGVPKGGFPAAAGGGGNLPIGPGTGGRFSWGQLEQLWVRAGGRGGAAAAMASIAIAESGGDPRARNPSGASGLWQILGLPFPGNPFDPMTNARMAVAKYNANGFYPWISDPVAARLIAAGITRAKGGLVGYAAGGTAGGLRAKLAAEQKNEQAKYFGLEHSFAIGPAKYRTALTRQELATLARNQQLEVAAYRGLTGPGLTTAALHHLGATARAVQRTASDQELSRPASQGGHPLFAADLRKYLGQLSATASGTVPAGGGGTGGGTGGSGTPGGKITSARQLRAQLAAEQRGEQAKYFGLEHSFAIGPAKYRTKAVKAELAALTRNQAAELADYARVSGSGELADNVRLSGLNMANLKHLSRTADAESKTAAGFWLSHKPGGHPLFAKDLRKFLAQISATVAAGVTAAETGVPGLGLPPVTHTYGGDVGNRIAAFLSAVMAPFAGGGLVKSFDSGGWLSPGLTMAYNGTGKAERVGGPQAVTVVFDVTPSGSAFDQFLLAWLKKNVKIRGGGNVQTAFGAH